jgi:hypothetical protein
MIEQDSKGGRRKKRGKNEGGEREREREREGDGVENDAIVR